MHKKLCGNIFNDGGYSFVLSACLRVFLCAPDVCLCVCVCSQWGFCTLQPCPHATPTALFPSPPYTHKHARTSTHIHTLVHTASAQVAVSAARAADVVLIIGCDR